ncbi:MAG: ROK family protein [Candidatus Nanopelagicales bacterium]
MVSFSAATQDDVRRHNLARIVRRLHLNGAASRSELVALTGLNRSTVGVLISELVDAGLATEGAGSAGTVGRPSLVVSLDPLSAFVVAFDLRVERLIGAVIGVGGEVLARHELKHRRQSFGPQVAVKHVVAMTEALMESVPEGAAWVGAGISVPGIVDHEDGLVRVAPNLDWIDAPLGALTTAAMASQFGAGPQVLVGNDADLGAVAEQVRGAGVGSQNLVYISGEVGIGGGIIIDGRLMAGAGGYGGEVGHMVVNPQGELCRCGARGCWETEIGRDAVLRSAGKELDAGEVRDVVVAADSGDPVALETLRRVGEWLYLGIGNLVNIFNPEVVVLGGHLNHLIGNVPGMTFDQVGSSLRAPREQVRVVAPELHGDSTLIGAGELAFSALLTDPLGVLERSASLVAS